MARRMLAPIVSIKHYINRSNVQILSGAERTDQIAVGVVAPAVATTADVKQGSVIKSVYLEFWLGGDETAAESQFNFTIEKKRVEETDITNAQMNNLMSYPNKKNILYTTQGIVPAMLTGGMTIPVYRDWLKIPKGKQRFGLSDELVVNVSSVGAIRYCGFATYKEMT